MLNKWLGLTYLIYCESSNKKEVFSENNKIFIGNVSLENMISILKLGLVHSRTCVCVCVCDLGIFVQTTNKITVYLYKEKR